MRVCLNMIVKNEMANLPRCLAAVAPHISTYAIADTGSTDGTQAFIREFFEKRGIKGVLVEVPFENFAQARNYALVFARQTTCDYILLVDADMELVGEIPETLKEAAYNLVQRAGQISYSNTRLLHVLHPAEYVGVTHEYLSVHGGITANLDEAWFIDHASGSNRPEKYERDVRLLKQALKDNPDDVRSMFYLANTYRDAGQHKLAIPLYQRRIKAGGWDEEVWHAQLSLARCWRDGGPHAAWFIEEAFKAYEMRPQRLEPIYDLAKYFREQDKPKTGYMFAQFGLHKRMPKDLLFVETYPYEWGFMEEVGICGFYNGTNGKAVGAAYTDDLRLARKAPAHVRETAERNSFWYIPTLGELAPSMKAVRYDVPLDNYVPMNPSVTLHNDHLLANVRYVNYRITDTGQYDMQGDTAIRTRNMLVGLDDQLAPVHTACEVQWSRPAPIYDLVIGFEDSRLISCDGHLFTLSNVREQNREGWCQQTLARLDEDGTVQSWRTIPAPWAPVQHEKNWMPWYAEKDHLRFVYRLGSILTDRGKVWRGFEPLLKVDNLSGGSQLVKYGDGWLAVVHQALANPQTGLRYYQHRFVEFSKNGEPTHIGSPFVFFDRQIEFAAGMCWHPNGTDLVISLGVRDCEAWFVTIPALELPL